jgi:DNA-binding CsgD family transcriptional regulator
MRIILDGSLRNCKSVSKEPQPVLFDEIDKRCQVLGETHALSKREIEILSHIAKGRTKNYIAETLFISENTVRWHTKRAYAKFGIHSKQELLQHIGIEERLSPGEVSLPTSPRAN